MLDPVKDPGNCIFHYFQGEPDKIFVREELVHVPDNTQVPPEWVSKWK